MAQTNYEMGFVNTISTDKIFALKAIEVADNTNKDTLMTEETTLKPEACLISPIRKLSKLSRLIITSKMIIAKPAVFCLSDEKMDVIHG